MGLVCLCGPDESTRLTGERNLKQEVDLCPREPFYVASFLKNILFTSGTFQKGSVITAFYRIRWAHHVIGFDSPTDNPFAQLAFEGCQRLCKLETTKENDKVLS